MFLVVEPSDVRRNLRTLSQAARNESLETEDVKERDERVVFHTRVMTDYVEQNE